MSRAVKAMLLFGIGTLLLFPFEATITLLLGVVFLLVFVVYGVFTVASPEFLAADDEDDSAAAGE